MPGISVNKIAIPFKGGGMSWSSYWTTQYQVVYDAMTNKPVTYDMLYQSRFVKRLVDGDVWDDLDILDIYGTHTNDGNEALINWKNPGTNNPSVVNSPVFTKKKGFLGVAATTSYLNLNYTPRTQASNFALVSNHFGVFSPSLHANSKRPIGVESNGNILFFTASQTSVLARNVNSTGDTITSILLHGCLISNRSAADATQFYLDGVKKHDGTTAAQAALPNASLFALAENSAGSPNAITDGYLFAAFAGASLTEPKAKILSDALTELFESYFIKRVVTTIPDTIESVKQTNTGIAINTTLSEIYIVSAIEGVVYVYTYDLMLKRKITPPAGAYVAQGLTWDSTRSLFVSWVSGNVYVWSEAALVRTYALAGTAGSLSYNVTDDCLYSLSVADTVIKKHVYNVGTDEWEYDSSINVLLADEGVAYDSDTDTIWYNQNNGFIANIQKDGTVLGTYKQPAAVLKENEGLVYNPIRGTLYLNADTHYHGDVVGGNKTWELDLGVYS